jgi:hypothetical protein
MSVVLEDETYEAIEEALKQADLLCTAVISGKPGQMTSALNVARALSDLKRQRTASRSRK